MAVGFVFIGGLQHVVFVVVQRCQIFWYVNIFRDLQFFMIYLYVLTVIFSGKVVWATATLPYVVLSLLLARGLLLPGAAQGIAYYLRPQLARLADTQVCS